MRFFHNFRRLPALKLLQFVCINVLCLSICSLNLHHHKLVVHRVTSRVNKLLLLNLVLLAIHLRHQHCKCLLLKVLSHLPGDNFRSDLLKLLKIKKTLSFPGSKHDFSLNKLEQWWVLSLLQIALIYSLLELQFQRLLTLDLLCLLVLVELFQLRAIFLINLKLRGQESQIWIWLDIALLHGVRIFKLCWLQFLDHVLVFCLRYESHVVVVLIRLRLSWCCLILFEVVGNLELLVCGAVRLFHFHDTYSIFWLIMSFQNGCCSTSIYQLTVIVWGQIISKHWLSNFNVVTSSSRINLLRHKTWGLWHAYVSLDLLVSH